MKLCFALLIVALAAWSGVLGYKDCGNKDSINIRSFSKRLVKISMPCKYNAVRQQCGDYFITLTPGIISVGKWYRLDTLWLGIKDKYGKEWEGRTTNKKAVKYINEMSDELFTQKDSSGLSTSEVFTFSKGENHTAIAEANDGSFNVTFRPWDPDNVNFSRSLWSFKCFREMNASEYPTQVCGYQGKKDGLDGLTPEQTFLYNVFTDNGTNITQVDEKCIAAEDAMQNECGTKEKKRGAIISCGQILTHNNRRKCVTKYACSPMDVFVDCVQWVCGSRVNKTLCEKLGAGIDLCREFKDGNLTKKVRDANCYKDFLPIDDD